MTSGRMNNAASLCRNGMLRECFCLYARPLRQLRSEERRQASTVRPLSRGSGNISIAKWILLPAAELAERRRTDTIAIADEPRLTGLRFRKAVIITRTSNLRWVRVGTFGSCLAVSWLLRSHRDAVSIALARSKAFVCHGVPLRHILVARDVGRYSPLGSPCAG